MKAPVTRGLLAIAMGVILLNLPTCRDHGCCDDRAYGISGTVSNSSTGAPIGSAKVTLFDTSDAFDPCLTDSGGRFSLPLYGSNATLFVRKEGYDTQSRELKNITSDQSGIDFKLATQSKVNERR